LLDQVPFIVQTGLITMIGEEQASVEVFFATGGVSFFGRAMA